MKIIFFLKKIWNRWFGKPNQVFYCDDLPEEFAENTYYLIGSKANTWLLAFICPCGCQEIVQLNLLNNVRPRWKFSINDHHQLTVHPSVWRRVGCKSHFFIKSGKVIWA